MKGLFFAHFAPDTAPANKGRINIRVGQVREPVGAGYRLEFEGQHYNFSNVIGPEKLQEFAFFNTEGERQAFIAELMSQNQAPNHALAPAVTDPPADLTPAANP